MWYPLWDNASHMRAAILFCRAFFATSVLLAPSQPNTEVASPPHFFLHHYRWSRPLSLQLSIGREIVVPTSTHRMFIWVILWFTSQSAAFTPPESQCIQPVFTFVNISTVLPLDSGVDVTTFESIRSVGYAAQCCLAEIAVLWFHILTPFTSHHEAVVYQNNRMMYPHIVMAIFFFIVTVSWIFYLCARDRRPEHLWANIVALGVGMSLFGFISFFVVTFWPTNSSIATFTYKSGNLFILLPNVAYLAWSVFGFVGVLHAEEIKIEMKTNGAMVFVPLWFVHCLYGVVLLFVGATVLYTMDSRTSQGQQLYLGAGLILISMAIIYFMYSALFTTEGYDTNMYIAFQTLSCITIFTAAMLLLFPDDRFRYQMLNRTEFSEWYFYIWMFFILIIVVLWLALAIVVTFSICTSCRTDRDRDGDVKRGPRPRRSRASNRTLAVELTDSSEPTEHSASESQSETADVQTSIGSGGHRYRSRRKTEGRQ